MRKFVLIGVLVMLTMALSAFQPAAPQPIGIFGEEPPTPPDHSTYSAYYAALEEGPHGDTWGEGKGPNTWCARCHSPQNWDPAAFVGPPPSCMTCKFPTDDEMRIAEGNPFVPEEE